MHVAVQAGLDVGRTEAEESIRAVATLSEGVRRPVAIDFRGLRSMNREARRYYAGPKTAEAVCAAALIISSPLTRAIGNFFMGLNKPLSPTRMFTDKTAAIEWLREFLQREVA